MQKLINVLALSSFAVSAAIVGGGTYLYLNKDDMIQQVKENVTKHATEAITDALPGLLDASMPEIPEMPSTTGGAILTPPAGFP
jgi:hypothetical protein